MTLILDRRFRQVGRIKRSAGTTHAPTFRRINEMLSGLFERGRFDILRSIKDGTLSPLQVYDAYRVNELHRLPTEQTIAPLAPTLEKWIAGYECSDAHRLSLLQSKRHVLSVARTDSTVSDLPRLIAALRVKMQGTHARSFNLARSAAQAFVRSTLKRTHPLWAELAGTDPLKVKPVRPGHALAVPEVKEIAEKLFAGHSRNLWGMVLTGMLPSEYWGRWNVQADRIHVAGTKRKGRVRDVPLIQRTPVPHATPKAFSIALGKVSDITPKDLRKTYATWMEAAGIPRARRMMYLGHGKRDVTDLYERHEVAAFLAEDAERLKRFVGATEVPLLRLEKKA